ncbi:MAG TPA: hypothetical protein VFX12_02075 [Vicinamibacterales bacterium]|nr:hypothetical protein [Vicinamibacterales bacterium]
MARKVKTWIWVVAGLFALAVLVGITLAAAGLWFARTHIDIHSTTTRKAAAEFETIRRQFADQKPLIELDDRGHVTRTNTDRPSSAIRPDSLNILAFDPDQDRVVKMSIPFWLLRLKMRGTRIDIGGDRVDLADLKLTVEDLERYGPTLIVDHTGRDGERVLVWTK